MLFNFCKKVMLPSLILLLAQAPSAKAQALDPTVRIIPPSPNSASIGKFGEIPVNYSSGQANLSIKLLDLKEGSLNLPISINYNYSGYRPSELPGVVGKGWSLMAGGVVTRVVRNIPDDHHGGNNLGYLYNSANINTLLTADDSLNCSGDGCPVGFNQGYLDGEPDMFYFSAGSLNGKFFFGQDGQPHIVSDRKLKIQFTHFLTNSRIQNAVHDSFYSFTITDEAGTIYRFGDPVASVLEMNVNQPMQNVEYSFAQNGLLQPSATNYLTPVSAWLLQEIEDVNGNKIKLTYKNDYRDSNGYIAGNRQRVTQSPYDYFEQWPGHSYAPFYSESYSVSSENFLTQISGTGWKVNFDYNNLQTGSLLHSLKSVSLTAADGNPVKQFELTYSSSDMHAVLDSLKEKAITTGPVVYKTHTFYYNDFPSGQYFERGLDHWGYYNGVNNSTLLPFAPYNANRDPVFAYTVMGSLKKITYPTGGSSTFEYEPNQYGYVRQSNLENNQVIGKKTGGGIRIRRITDVDINGNPPVVKDYSYDLFANSGVSSGVTVAPVNNYYVSLLVTTPSGDLQWLFATPTPDIQQNWQVWKSSSLYSLSQSPVYYFNVRETIGSALRTDYEFTSHLDYPDNLGVNYGLGDGQEGPYESYDFARSLPKSVTYYKNGSPALKKQTTWAVGVKYRGKSLWRELLITSAQGTFQFAKGVPVLSGIVQKMSDTTTNYDGTAEVLTVAQYEYDPSYYPLRKQTTVGSDGKTTETSYKYPFDMTGTVYSSMVAKNIISPVIETTVNVNNVQQLFSRNNYDVFNGGQYLPKTIENQVGSNTIFSKQIFNNYNAQGLLLEAKQPDGISTSYQWGYNNQYPVAKVVNAHNYSATVAGAGVDTKNVSIYLGPTGSNYPNPSTTTFIQNTAGDIVLQFSAGVPFTTATTNFSFSLTGPSNKSGSFFCSNGTCNLPAGGITYTNMPQGNYTLSLTGSTTFQSYTFQIGIACSYQALLQNIVTENQYFYEGFEEGAGNTSPDDSRTGHYSHTGAYTKVLSGLSAGNYLLTYWQKSGSVWLLVSTPVTITGSTYTFGASPAINAQIDDVRFYPANAQMTTYTYDPLIGMTSATDEKGITTYYEYDSFQRLMNIKDKDKNIVKHLDYHYQNQ
jgi:hypothetical protein